MEGRRGGEMGRKEWGKGGRRGREENGGGGRGIGDLE
jgi:hypothetical protein